MAKTYREIAIAEVLGTVEEAMGQVIDRWGDLPAPMKEAIEPFHIQLGAEIDSVEFIKRELDRQVRETYRGKALRRMSSVMTFPGHPFRSNPRAGRPVRVVPFPGPRSDRLPAC